MKVNVKAIPPEGLHLKESQSVSSWDLDSKDFKYTGKLYLEGDFYREQNNIYVHVSVLSTREVCCSRCLEVHEQELKEEFDFYYKLLPDQEFIEIDSDVRQEMILNFPLKPLCSENCKGICPVCGKNLNKGKCNCSPKFIKFIGKEE